MDKIVTTRAKAFSSQPAKNYQFSVDEKGTVRVWNSVTKQFTTCHSLSHKAEERIRKLA